MSARPLEVVALKARYALAALGAVGLLVTACHNSTPPAAHPAPASSPGKSAPVAPAGSQNPADRKSAPREEESPTVVLKPQQVKSIGLATKGLTAAEHHAESAGYGSVLAHDTVAQPVAELRTAQAIARQSQSALQRARSLAGTPGAVSADIEETAARQATVDAAALTLAQQRLAGVVGGKLPWPALQGQAILEKIAAGSEKLVRVTFPLGALPGETPKVLRATGIGTQSTPAGPSWALQPVWPAQADASVPGRSFFALLKNGDVAEGDRLMVYASTGAAKSGVIVPASAVVTSDGKYWCYLEREAGTYARIEISIDSPTPDGYFVTEGVHVGDRIVTSAAAQLLAQESSSDAEPD